MHENNETIHSPRYIKSSEDQGWEIRADPSLSSHKHATKLRYDDVGKGGKYQPVHTDPPFMQINNGFGNKQTKTTSTTGLQLLRIELNKYHQSK